MTWGFKSLHPYLWRITQVWLKGTVLKTVRWVKPRKSSNLLSSLFRRSIGVVVISSPCHGEDRRFKSVMDRKLYSKIKKYNLLIFKKCYIIKWCYSLTCGCSLVVKPQPSKLLSRVRFSSPAYYGPIAQLVRAHA